MNGYCHEHKREYVWEKNAHYCPQCREENNARLKDMCNSVKIFDDLVKSNPRNPML